MEEEICQYNKYGFCKYRDGCKKKHVTLECEDPDCMISKNCKQRHPKPCRKYNLGKCRFENECAYKHIKPHINQDHEQLKENIKVLEKAVEELSKTNKDNEQLNDKVLVLEKVLHAMTRKVLNLETELKDIKKKSIIGDANKDPNYEHVKGKKSETKSEVSEDNLSDNFNHKDMKGTTSTPKGKNDNDDKQDIKDEKLSCKECDYVCKKEKTLKNHMLTKHDVHQCKECMEKLPNFMQLLKHIAKHHSDDESETKVIQLEEEAVEKKVHKEDEQLEELEAELSALKKLI